jgi:lysophospholipase
VLSRSLGKTGTTVPDVCAKCFQKYCWDGTLNSTVPGNYNPTFKVEGVSLGGRVRPGGKVLALVVGVIAGLVVV